MNSPGLAYEDHLYVFFKSIDNGFNTRMDIVADSGNWLTSLVYIMGR